jgi:predicted RNase H-like nuclease
VIDPEADIAGVDGCKGGWIMVRQRPGVGLSVQVIPSFAELIRQAPAPAIVAVDMPIGLPSVSGRGGRGPEALIRPLLGMRQSSVFSIPSRAAVHACEEPFTTLDAWYEGHRRASDVARQTSDPARGVSIQAYGIFDKIRQLDAVLRADPALCERVIESHPELAFWRLNGGRPMSLPKKVNGRVHPPGMEERKALLASHGIDRQLLDARPPSGAGEDDLLDAAAMLLIAARHAKGETVSFPDPPGRDDHGIRIAIWV